LGIQIAQQTFEFVVNDRISHRTHYLTSVEVLRVREIRRPATPLDNCRECLLVNGIRDFKPFQPGTWYGSPDYVDLVESYAKDE
jgi:hypothetical protein